MESAATDTINPESSFDEGLRLHFLLLNRRENKEITQMKRKSSRISTSSASVSTQSLVSTIAAEKKADKPKSTWYYLGSDKKKIDDACEPTSSILSYYQGLALLLPTSLPTCLFPVATNPKWEKNIEKGDFGPVYIVSRDMFGYYDDNDDFDPCYKYDDFTSSSSHDPICKVFIGSDLLIEANILNVHLSDLRKM